MDKLPIALWFATLDLLGIAVFSASGALAAAQKRQTLVTFTFFAVVTGVGGGTVRDLLIGAPVFWVQDQRVPFVCLSMALLVWFTPRRIWREKALDWFDAIGLAAYAVFGAAKSLAFGIQPLPAVMMGVITACVGGIIRDVLAGEPSILLRPEIYVTAALAAALLYVALIAFGITAEVAAWIAAAAGFGVRAGAMLFGWNLPGYARRD